MSASEAEVLIAEDVVVVRRKGNSVSAVANILGVEPSDCGRRVIYLDRLIHQPFEGKLGSYEVSGAISTIITVMPAPLLVQEVACAPT
jgi:hypothetical protein